MSPKFITLEGGDGTGKSTQANLLQQHIRAAGCDVILTREPGGCAAAERLRNLLVTGQKDQWLPESEVLLHMAARCEHVAHTIMPALEAGTWVICDRFVDSTRAYQHFGFGIDRDLIEELHRRLLGGLEADLTFLFDAPVHQTLKRARMGALDTAQSDQMENRYESEDMDFHARVRSGFSELYLEMPERIRMIDATADIQTIHSHIVNEMGAKWPELRRIGVSSEQV